MALPQLNMNGKFYLDQNNRVMTVEELKNALSHIDGSAEIKFLNNFGDLKTVQKVFNVDPLDGVSDSYIVLI